MAIKGAKTIAEYAIRQWLLEHNFAMECFILRMAGNEGILTDVNGDTLTLVYDARRELVYVKDEEVEL